MPIDKSTPWGEEVPTAASEFISSNTFGNERELSTFLSKTRISEIRMTGGDFVRLTGGAGTVSGKHRRYRSDVLEVRGHDSATWTIGTVELRRRKHRLFGGFVIISNLGERGTESYSSRAHPNDGRFEIIEALDGLSWRERFTLSKRFSSGGDLSHPSVRQRQATQYSSKSPLHVFVDGKYLGRKVVEIEIHPDLLWIHV